LSIPEGKIALTSPPQYTPAQATGRTRFKTDLELKSTCCYFARFGKCDRVIDLPKNFLNQVHPKVTSNITEMGLEIREEMKSSSVFHRSWNMALISN
jgi:hypothetical protein